MSGRKCQSRNHPLPGPASQEMLFKLVSLDHLSRFLSPPGPALPVVAEHGGQVPLGSVHVPSFPCGVVRHLVLADLADGKVLALLVGKEEARDRGRGEHRHALRELDRREIIRLQQLPHLVLLRVVRLRGVARRRADALVLHLEHVRLVERLVGGVSPLRDAHVAMQLLCKRLRETIAERLCHDLAVVVGVGLVRRNELVHSDAGRDGEQPDVVLDAARLGRDEVRHRQVLRLLLAQLLLPHSAQRLQNLGTLLVLVHLDVITDSVGREEGSDAVCRQLAAIDNALEHLLRFIEHLLGLGANGLVLEDLGVPTVGVLATKLPHGEEGVPVDVREKVLERHVAVLAAPDERGLGRLATLPVHAHLHLARLLKGLELALLQGGVVLLTHLLVQLARLRRKVVLQVGVEERRDNRDSARGIEDVHGGGVGVARLDLDGRVHARGGRTSDEERHLHVPALHLLGHGHHLVERGRDEARESNDVGPDLLSLVKDVLARAHDTNVDNVVVVAAEHDADDVLADVVHVALDRRHQHAPRLLLGHLGVLEQLAGLLLLHERSEVCDGLLHHARRLDDLGEEHLASSEEVTDQVHALHEGALDDVQGRRVRVLILACLLGIGLDELVNALEKRVDEAVLARPRAPLRSLLDSLAVVAASLERSDALLLRLRAVEQLLRRVGVLVEHGILAHHTQRLLDVVVDREVAGVHDRHVHAGLDGVVEEDRVHGLTDDLEAAEGEGEVGKSARDLAADARILDDLGRLDEVDAVVVVLLEPRADGEDVEVKHNVDGVELDNLREDLERALADAHLRLAVGRLPFLVKRHHNHRRAVPLHQLRLLNELLLADLERNRVHDALALEALEPRDADVELGGVDHHRDLGDLGLRGNEVAELAHAVLAVKHAVVEVDVEQLRAVLDLLLRNLRRLAPVVTDNQLLEPDRARDVAALANVLEHRIVGDHQVLQPRQPHVVRLLRNLTSRLHIRHRIGNRLDVVRRRPAASANHVHQTVSRPRAELRPHLSRCQVVASHGVRETRVGVGVGVAGRAVGEALHEGSHLVGAEGAVESDAEGVGMADGDPESLRRLSRERAPRHVDDGAGNDDRHLDVVLLKKLVNGKERGLGVERVEDRLDKQHVAASLDESNRLLLVRRDKLLERDVTERRVLNLRGDGERPVCGADGAGAKLPDSCCLLHLNRRQLAQLR
mmetsp:Transcript_27462/g.56288  ORF Transcript_27462/g.56288 Transcript_27462/m.56288 type:complete len:1189 (+) Transcript_27462:341-3907(+)